jgi:hypothetical protein
MSVAIAICTLCRSSELRTRNPFVYGTLESIGGSNEAYISSSESNHVFCTYSMPGTIGKLRAAPPGDRRIRFSGSLSSRALSIIGI